MISLLRKPIGLLKEPSILEQTKWPVGFYSFPNQPRNVEFFNCGIIKFGNITWLVARKRITNIGRVGHNRISFWNLSNNRPIAEKEVHFYKTWMDEHHEDPRVIAHGKTLLMSYCNFRPYSKAHQCMAEVHKDFRVKRPIHIRFGKNGPTVMSNTGHEKNWIWFFHNDQLFFIYKTDPHTVCRYGGQGKVVQVFENTKACPDWKHGEIRGGTPPIRIGDEYFAFFHSSVDWRFPKRRYYMGAYAFRAEPPFRITRYTPHPLLYGSEADPRNMGAPIVVFPCGSLFENGEWLVTMGVNDCRCAWIKIPHLDLIERMVRL